MSKASSVRVGSDSRAQVCLDGVCELVRDVLSERVERVPEAALSNEFQRGAAHPVEDIELLRAVSHSRGDRVFKLRIAREQTHTTAGCGGRSHLLDDGRENGRHLAKVLRGEQRIQHLALAAVLVPWRWCERL